MSFLEIFFLLVPLALLIVLIVIHWSIWNNRFRQLTQRFDALVDHVDDFVRQLRALRALSPPLEIPAEQPPAPEAAPPEPEAEVAHLRRQIVQEPVPGVEPGEGESIGVEPEEDESVLEEAVAQLQRQAVPESGVEAAEAESIPEEAPEAASLPDAESAEVAAKAWVPGYAGFWRRFVAALIDGVVLWIPLTIFSLIVPVKSAGFFGSFLLTNAVYWIYFAAMESSSNQATLGKMALGIVVTDLSGERISFGRATGRYFGKIVSTIILAIGFLMAAFTQRKQALHDIMAGCLVVMKSELAEEVAPAVRPEAVVASRMEPAPVAKARESLSATLKQRFTEVADWETLIGGQWLNKIGVVILVIGVALLLGYLWPYMGPMHRIAIGFATSLAILIGGVLLERIEKYSLFAKPLIGGGWALLYFTAYAAHNIEAARVIESPVWGFVLLGLVAAAMILHTLKYRSQIATGFAYFLGFLTVAISLTVATNPPTGFSLVASGFLAASIIAILWKIRWFYLGLFGMAATYLNHLLWLEYRLGGPAPEAFWLGVGMLVFYWLLFVAVGFILKPENEREEQIGLAINLGNTMAFLGLSLRMVWPLFPEGRYILTGLAGIAYIVISYLLNGRGRRKLYLANASVSVVLIALTFPLNFETSGVGKHFLVIPWLIQAGAVMAMGMYFKEIIFRVLAYLLSLAVLGAVIYFNLFGQPEPTHFLRWLTVSPVIAYFYYLWGQLQLAWNQGEVRKEERDGGVFSSYVASALLAALLWKELSPDLVGLGWLAAGLALFEAGVWLRQVPLRTQGYLLSALALAAFFLVNLFGLTGFGLIEQQGIRGLPRWQIIPLAILAFYYLYWRLHGVAAEKWVRDEERQFPDLLSYAATALLTVLIWKEAPPVLVGLAWLAAGLVLFEVGVRFRQMTLRAQGYFLSAISVNAFYLINLYGLIGQQRNPGPIVWTFVPLAILAFYYLYWRLYRMAVGEWIRDEEKQYTDLPSYIASALLTVLLWKELDSVAVALVWGFLALLLFEAGTRLRQIPFRVQGHVLAALAFGRLFLANFTASGEALGLSHRFITIVPIILIFYYLLSRIREKREAGMGPEFEKQLPRLYSYGGAILLVLLARFEFGRTHTVISWALMGFVLFSLGVLWRDRDFRIQSFLIAVLAFWRSWSTNFYLFGSFYGISERIATTVPVIAAFYAAKFISLYRPEAFSQSEGDKAPNFLMRIDTNARILFSLLGTLLLTILLYYEVEGNLLTIAWTVEGLVLLVLGFSIRERTFRLSGLSLLIICVLKVFLIDLQGMDTIFRIISFIVLGVILLLVSFGYTKYKDVLRRYL